MKCIQDLVVSASQLRVTSFNICFKHVLRKSSLFLRLLVCFNLYGMHMRRYNGWSLNLYHHVGYTANAGSSRLLKLRWSVSMDALRSSCFARTSILLDSQKRYDSYQPFTLQEAWWYGSYGSQYEALCIRAQNAFSWPQYLCILYWPIPRIHLPILSIQKLLQSTINFYALQVSTFGHRLYIIGKLSLCN